MTSPLRVLLVDDNPDDRALVARELQAEYGAVELEEVIDASGLELALERTYDLVITDYQLNWSNGLAVLRRIGERAPWLPTVMFTGTGSEEVAVEAMKEGLDDYVIKSPQHFKRLASATRRAIERATRHRERRRLLSILEATPDFVGTSDVEGGVLYLNASGREMLGIPHDEDVTGRSIVGCHPDWAAERIAAVALPRAVAEGTWSGESALLTRDGREIPVSQVVIAHAHDGSVEYFSTVARDISRERSLQEQLQQAQKMEAVGRLAGGIAHDFNNLLTVILGEADHASETTSDPEVRRSFEEIRRAAARATKVTGQLLQFSRGRPSELTVFDLDELVRSMQSLMRRLIGENVRLVVRTTGGPSNVRADRGQIEQVLLNLVVNGRDAMPEGGLLAFETANVTLSGDDTQIRGMVDPGRYAMLAVSDSGTGMRPEVKERLFEPFFTTKAAGKGTGIGLATSYGIVRRHGGYIGVYSEVGQGTTMKVYLPHVDAPAETPSSAVVDPWKAFSGTGSILVVEDDDALRGVAARMLEALGYRTQVASTSEAALRLLAEPEREVDLLLTDVVLGETDGLALARAAREIRRDLRVLFMSGHTEEAVAHRAGGEAPPLLRKPFAVTDLGAGVRDALAAEAV